MHYNASTTDIKGQHEDTYKFICDFKLELNGSRVGLADHIHLNSTTKGFEW
jgi:hypothetical protein